MEKQELKNILKQQIVNVKFKKKDGTERHMKCTLIDEKVPVYKKKTERVKPENENTLVVWDLDKEDFRSFRFDSMLEYQIISEGYEL